MNFRKFKERICGPPTNNLDILDWNMSSCCRNHDDCYGNCAINKEVCDEKFKQDMLDLCDEKYSDNKFMKMVCKTQANVYYNVVKKFGNKYFQEYRKEC